MRRRRGHLAAVGGGGRQSRRLRLPPRPLRRWGRPGPTAAASRGTSAPPRPATCRRPSRRGRARSPVADPADEIGRVRDEQDRAPFALEALHPLETLALERLVTDREHLVDEEDVGIDVHGDREPEPDVHTRRVVPHLHVDELLEPANATISSNTELMSRFERPRIEAFMKMFSRPVSSGWKPAPSSSNAASRPRDDLTLVGLEDPGDALEQRRLARPVVTEDPDRRALLDLDVDVVERDEVLERDAPEVDHPLLQRRVVLVVEAEVLRDVTDLDRGGHLPRAPRRSSLRCDRTPRSRSRA